MLRVIVKDGNIERALKEYKRKTLKTGLMKDLRQRQEFHAPSDVKRRAMEKAKYAAKFAKADED